MSYRSSRAPVWVLLGVILWLACLLGTAFVWAMYAGVAYGPDDPPIANIGLLVILGAFILLPIVAMLATRAYRKR